MKSNRELAKYGVQHFSSISFSENERLILLMAYTNEGKRLLTNARIAKVFGRKSSKYVVETLERIFIKIEKHRKRNTQ